MGLATIWVCRIILYDSKKVYHHKVYHHKILIQTKVSHILFTPDPDVVIMKALKLQLQEQMAARHVPNGRFLDIPS